MNASFSPLAGCQESTGARVGACTRPEGNRLWIERPMHGKGLRTVSLLVLAGALFAAAFHFDHLTVTRTKLTASGGHANSEPVIEENEGGFRLTYAARNRPASALLNVVFQIISGAPRNGGAGDVPLGSDSITAGITDFEEVYVGLSNRKALDRIATELARADTLSPNQVAVRGTLYDSSGDPIAGAQVRLRTGKESTRTRQDGTFLLFCQRLNSAQSQTIECRAATSDRWSATRSVEISAGELEVGLSLQRHFLEQSNLLYGLRILLAALASLISSAALLRYLYIRYIREPATCPNCLGYLQGPQADECTHCGRRLPPWVCKEADMLDRRTRVKHYGRRLVLPCVLATVVCITGAGVLQWLPHGIPRNLGGHMQPILSSGQKAEVRILMRRQNVGWPWISGHTEFAEWSKLLAGQQVELIDEDVSALKASSKWQLGPGEVTRSWDLASVALNIAFCSTWPAVLCLAAALRFRIRSNYRKRTNRCLTCGYLLEGLVSRRCPECGTVFMAGDR